MNSNYITAEGEKRLRDELADLWNVQRPQITQQVADAAAMGDRSENAEYIYGKKRLREIDRRIQFLAHRLDKLTVVRDKPPNCDRVYFGAWIKVEGEDGVVHRFRIVGPDETDMDRAYISVDSPMARAMMRRQLGDVVTVQRPKGDAQYEIVQISYEPISE